MGGRQRHHAELLQPVLVSQCDVFALSQAEAAGLTRAVVRAAIHAGRWQRLHPGVYLAVTGQPTWLQRVWAAILACGPSTAAASETALRLEGFEISEDRIFVAVDHRRQVRGPPGVVVSRRRRHSTRVHPVKQPPRDRLEHALLEVAGRTVDDAAAIALIADAVQQRRTTPARLEMALGQPGCLPRRRFLVAVIHDVATGAYSLLEVRYLRDVERAHGLPRGRRQARDGGPDRPYYRDVRYDDYAVVVELDGRLGHEMAFDRWADMTRDNAALAAGEASVRLGYQHVMRAACATAALVGQVLSDRGWSGEPRPCGPGCSVGLRRAG